MKEIYKYVERKGWRSHGDIDSGLADYSDKRFDYVILNEFAEVVDGKGNCRTLSGQSHCRDPNFYLKAKRTLSNFLFRPRAGHRRTALQMV